MVLVSTADYMELHGIYNYLLPLLISYFLCLSKFGHNSLPGG